MAYNTRSIKKDVDGRPVPQYFNSTADDYEPLLGENGAARSVLYGPNGQPLSVIDNKLAVRAADLETLIGGVKTAVDVLAGTVDTQAGVQKVALSGRIAERLYFAENVTVTAGSGLVLLSRSERLEFRKVAVGFYFYQAVSSEQQYRALVHHQVADVPAPNRVQMVVEAAQLGAGIVELEGYIYSVVMQNRSTQDQTARAIWVWGVR